MGNPSSAKNDTSYSTNYLMEKPQYVICYNKDRAIPNWVAWHLDKTRLGNLPRPNPEPFRADSSLPKGWYQVQDTSYRRSKYDRGHHCPSADRNNSTENISSTYFMTNMMPQTPHNNQGPWEKLEEYCRTLVTQGKELYIYAYGYGLLGTIKNKPIAIPSLTWKVIMVLDDGSDDINRVTTTTRLIAVGMTNESTKINRNDDWKKFRISVDSVETITGYNFFSNVPDSIQRIIESAVDSL